MSRPLQRMRRNQQWLRLESDARRDQWLCEPNPNRHKQHISNLNDAQRSEQNPSPFGICALWALWFRPRSSARECGLTLYLASPVLADSGRGQSVRAFPAGMAAVRLHAFAACAGRPELSSRNLPSRHCFGVRGQVRALGRGDMSPRGKSGVLPPHSKSCAISFPLAAAPEILYQKAHEQIRARIALAGAVLAVDRIGAN